MKKSERINKKYAVYKKGGADISDYRVIKDLETDICKNDILSLVYEKTL